MSKIHHFKGFSVVNGDMKIKLNMDRFSRQYQEAQYLLDGMVMDSMVPFMPMITGKFKPAYPISASTGCIYAGNDIQMPGCQKNVDDIVEAVKTGKEIDGYKITKADLQFNAANVIRVVARTM